MSGRPSIGSDPLPMGEPVLANLRLTHKKAGITLLEAAFFKDMLGALQEMNSLEGVEECFILQTCNRVELFALTSRCDAVDSLLGFWRDNMGKHGEKFDEALEITTSKGALLHLLRLAAGLESMVIGEDQILGQLKSDCEKAQAYGTAGPLFDLIMFKVLSSGRAIRMETGINRGAVSIGSLAVNLIEESLGTFNGRAIGIVGAGKTATLVGKYLTYKRKPELFVSNRTLERGEALARILGGSAVPLKRVSELLEAVDAIFVATSAPHPVITQKMVEEASLLRSGREIYIIDLSQPRNVEESVGLVPGVTLYNIDNLRSVTEKNLAARLETAKASEALVLNELESLETILRRERAEPLVTAIWSSADRIRSRELERAIGLMEDIDDEQRKTIEKFSQVLVTRILHNPVKVIREAATRENFETIRTAEALFNVHHRGRNVD